MLEYGLSGSIAKGGKIRALEPRLGHREVTPSRLQERHSICVRYIDQKLELFLPSCSRLSSIPIRTQVVQICFVKTKLFSSSEPRIVKRFHVSGNFSRTTGLNSRGTKKPMGYRSMSCIHKVMHIRLAIEAITGKPPAINGLFFGLRPYELIIRN